MKFVKQSVEIMGCGGLPIDGKAMLKHIELCGRVCYKSEDKITDDSAERFVRKIIKSGHESVLEHASITVRFVCDRGVSHEIVRHRLASYSMESTRYCVAGDMRLTSSNAHNSGITVEWLYNNLINSQNGAWKRIKVRQYNEKTGELTFSGVRNVVYNGEKPCIRLRTKLGYELVCTPDHRILTPCGYIAAENMGVGAGIYVNGTDKLYTNYDWLYNQSIKLNKTFVEIGREFGFNPNTVKKWARKLKIPKKGTGYFNVGRSAWNKGITDERQAEALRKWHHCGRQKDKIMKEDTCRYQKHKGDECAICGGKNELQVHHIDKNRDNNNPVNLITLCNVCHARVHSQNLLTAYADEIVEISDAGTRKVYDIEMDSEYHNFAANGVIVHNCDYSKDKFGGEISVIEPAGCGDELALLESSCICAETIYLHMISTGVSPQMARAVLPTCLKTELIMTANLREWRHFLRLRTSDAAHPQIRALAVELRDKLREAVPAVFDDI